MDTELRPLDYRSWSTATAAAVRHQRQTDRQTHSLLVLHIIQHGLRHAPQGVPTGEAEAKGAGRDASAI